MITTIKKTLPKLIGNNLQRATNYTPKNFYRSLYFSTKTQDERKILIFIKTNDTNKKEIVIFIPEENANHLYVEHFNFPEKSKTEESKFTIINKYNPTHTKIFNIILKFFAFFISIGIFKKLKKGKSFQKKKFPNLSLISTM